jgi:hypothetical protein
MLWLVTCFNTECWRVGQKSRPDAPQAQVNWGSSIATGCQKSADRRAIILAVEWVPENGPCQRWQRVGSEQGRGSYRRLVVVEVCGFVGFAGLWIRGFAASRLITTMTCWPVGSWFQMAGRCLSREKGLTPPPQTTSHRSLITRHYALDHVTCLVLDICHVTDHLTVRSNIFAARSLRGLNFLIEPHRPT